MKKKVSRNFKKSNLHGTNNEIIFKFYKTHKGEIKMTYPSTTNLSDTLDL